MDLLVRAALRRIRFPHLCGGVIAVLACVQAAGARAEPADPGVAAPAEAVGLVCVHNPRLLRRDLGGTAVGGLVDGSPRLSGSLDRALAPAKLAVALYAGMSLWDFLDRYVEQAALVAIDSRRLAVVLDVAGHAEQIDELLRTRVRPRLRSLAGSTTQATAAGARLDVFDVPGLGRTAIGRAGRWLVIGPVGSVRQTVRTIEGERGRLSEVPVYRKIRTATRQGGECGLSFYVNVRASSPPSQTGAARLLGLDGVVAVGGTCGVREERLTSRVFCALRPDAMGWLAMLAAAPNGRLTGARFVPDDYDLLVAWDPGTGSQIGARFWERIAPIDPPLAESLRQFNGAAGQFGVNIHREIFLRFDGECFLAARTPRLDRLGEEVWPAGVLAFEPIFGVKVRQPGKILGAWQRLAAAGMVAAQGVRIETERVGDHPVYVLRAFGEPILGVTFSVTFVDDRMLMSLSFEALAGALRAVQAGKTLADDPRFKDVRRALPDEATLMAYVDVGRFVGRIADAAATQPATRAADTVGDRLAAWLGGVLAQGPGSTTMPGRLGAEVLRGLARWPGLGLAVSGQDGGILVEVHIPPAGTAPPPGRTQTRGQP